MRTGSHRGCAQRAAAVRKSFCQGPHSSPGSSRASVECARYCWRENSRAPPPLSFYKTAKWTLTYSGHEIHGVTIRFPEIQTAKTEQESQSLLKLLQGWQNESGTTLLCIKRNKLSTSPAYGSPGNQSLQDPKANLFPSAAPHYHHFNSLITTHFSFNTPCPKPEGTLGVKDLGDCSAVTYSIAPSTEVPSSELSPFLIQGMAEKAWQQHSPLCFSAGRRSWHWNSCCWKCRASHLLGSVPAQSQALWICRGAAGSDFTPTHSFPSYLCCLPAWKDEPEAKSSTQGQKSPGFTRMRSSWKSHSHSLPEQDKKFSCFWMKILYQINLDSDCSAGSECGEELSVMGRSNLHSAY